MHAITSWESVRGRIFQIYLTTELVFHCWFIEPVWKKLSSSHLPWCAESARALVGKSRKPSSNEFKPWGIPELTWMGRAGLCLASGIGWIQLLKYLISPALIRLPALGLLLLCGRQDGPPSRLKWPSSYLSHSSGGEVSAGLEVLRVIDWMCCVQPWASLRGSGWVTRADVRHVRRCCAWGGRTPVTDRWCACRGVLQVCSDISLWFSSYFFDCWWR